MYGRKEGGGSDILLIRGSRLNIRLEDGTSSETSRRSREMRGTMAEFRWIKTSLFLILVLQFTAAATGQPLLSFTVRDGDEVTLPCNSLMDDQENCDFTEWLFYNSRSRLVFLFEDGKISDEAKDKSDRLSVSEKCSLVIKNVTDEDVGRYNCKQFRTGQQYQVAFVHLSVVTLTEHKDTEEVTVICSVSSYEGCRQTVKWLLEGQDVDKDNKDVMTSQSSCSSNVTFKTSHVVYTSKNSELLKCEVTTDQTKDVNLFPFSPPQSSGGDTTTTTTEDTTAGWWRIIFVSVGLAALIIIVVAVNICARIKEKRNQTDETAVCYDAEDETVNYENIRPPDGV